MVTFKNEFTRRLTAIGLYKPLSEIKGVALDLFKDMVSELNLTNIDFNKVNFIVPEMRTIVLKGNEELGRYPCYQCVPGCQVYHTVYMDKIFDMLLPDVNQNFKEAV